MLNVDEIKRQLIKHEGLKLRPYHDTVGKLTIGVGRNLEDVGISESEAEYLLENDIKRVISQLSKYDFFTGLDEIRQRVLIDMAFNMGLGGLLQFKNTLAAIELKNYSLAADHMIESRWAKMVGYRAQKLADMMRHGLEIPA